MPPFGCKDLTWPACISKDAEKLGRRWTISYRNNISSKSRICGTLSPNQSTLLVMSELVGLLLDVEGIPKQDCHDRQLLPENEHRACFGTVRRSLVLQLEDLFDSSGWITDTPGGRLSSVNVKETLVYAPKIPGIPADDKSEYRLRFKQTHAALATRTGCPSALNSPFVTP
jgi:hypothetical protein